MKEAFRFHRSEILSAEIPENQQIALMCIYMPNEVLTFKEINKGMIKALTRLQQKVQTL